MGPKRRDLLASGVGVAASLSSACGARAQATEPLRRIIPPSGETIPAIGLGTAGRWTTARTDEEIATLRETLRAFHAAGGSVIDTSDDYGRAEEVVGRLTEELGLRDSLFLATKISTTGRDAGTRQVGLSFQQLRAPHIELIAVHNLQDAVVNLHLLRELKQARRIRYVGVTTSFERQHEALVALMRREALDFVQVDFALDNREASERILPLARERGMAVMINLPLGRGRLLAAVRGKPLPPWAAEFDCRSWAQFFLKYVVSFEAVTCAIPGMGRPEHVLDNLGALRGRLPDAAMRRTMERFIDDL
jgi:aryl-alcohol dehydrogenase-like predicted oxidoreductase